MTLKGDKNSPVTILGLVIGGLREVIIGDKIELVDMKILSDETKHKKLSGTRKNIEYKYRYQIFLHGKFLGEYRTFTDISKKYSIDTSTVRGYSVNGRVTKRGHSFKQVINPKY